MGKKILRVLLGGCAASMLVAMSVSHADVAMENGTTVTDSRTSDLESIVVTARRQTENLQDVPVAVTVISPKSFDVKGSYTPYDLASDAPGLTVTSLGGDKNSIVYSIRGQSFASGTLFPAVITYFNEVPITQFGVGQFFDLDNIQVLRGPEGVLFGRVTDGGNVMVQPKHPTDALEGYVEAKTGDYDLFGVNGALNVPIVPEKFLVRAAFEKVHRGGYTRNVLTGQDLDNVDYQSFRLGVTLRPVDNLENYTVVAYEKSDDNSGTEVLHGLNPVGLTNAVKGTFGLFPGVYGINAQGAVVPYVAGLTSLTPANYVASIQNDLARQQQLGIRAVYSDKVGYDQRMTLYGVNTTAYDFSDDLHLKNIAGYTKVREYQHAVSYPSLSNIIYQCYSSCLGSPYLPLNSQEQFSDEIRLFGRSFNGKLNWSIGGYGDDQRPAEKFDQEFIAYGILQNVIVKNTITDSRAAFGYGEYDLASFIQGLKINGGVRFTKDSYNSQAATYTAPLPGTNTVGALSTRFPQTLANATVNTAVPYGECAAYPAGLFASKCVHVDGSFNVTTWSAGTTYNFSPQQMAYFKISTGYRPGGANPFAPVGASPLYGPEFDRSYEIGLKADWNLDGVKLRTNLAAYHDDYTDIQENVNVFTASGSPALVTTNVAGAKINGVEFEGLLIPITGLTLSLNYAYTDAKYNHVDTSGQVNPKTGLSDDPCNPLAATVVGFCTSNRFGYTPRSQFAASVNYGLPIDRDIGLITFGGRYYYQSSMATSAISALSPLSVEPGYGTVDLNATWTDVFGRPVDLGFFLNNVTNKVYINSSLDQARSSGIGTLLYTYAPPRMFGFNAKYRFGAAAGH